MLDDCLCTRREEICQHVLEPVRKPEILEVFDMDEEGEKYFLVALLEESRDRRKQIGIFGWWPIYEADERLTADPEVARQFEIAFDTVTALAAATFAAFAAFVLPHLPGIGPRINRFFAC